MMVPSKMGKEIIFLLACVVGSLAAPPPSEYCKNDCSEQPDGNHVLCNKCENGYYLSCTNGDGIEMPCALGEYRTKNGTKYNARLIYNPTMDACTHSNQICDMNNFGVRSCLTYGCAYRKDGDYPLCGEQCYRGYYGHCENGNMNRMSCEQNSEMPDVTLVFQPTSKKCEKSTEVCELNDQVLSRIISLKPTACVDGTNCVGRPDGSYALCDALACLDGRFASCSGEIFYEMVCALGWEGNDPTSGKLKRLIYNPVTDSCEYSSESCPPLPEVNNVTVKTRGEPKYCIYNCVGRANGPYPLCGEQCNGYYATCSNQDLYKMECQWGHVTNSEGKRNITRMHFDPYTEQCGPTVQLCDAPLFAMSVGAAGSRLTPSWILMCLLMKVGRFFYIVV
ncbi:uncharacterized protein LOC131933375 isoform X2 [Physella acuta]|uniref:uncharacterized protein LOC131933375 isoform X2 n=1 Tax=Physella acuta TaxID=109671 RepID=UPI0027DD9E99|nr:uncharacterized protein LOC131933375 isoform X2 [Physella acuta]